MCGAEPDLPPGESSWIPGFHNEDDTAAMSPDQAVSTSPNSSARQRVARTLRVLMYQFFPGGGIGRYTHELAQELRQRDDLDLSVVCSPDFEWLRRSSYDTRVELPSLRHANPLLRKSRFLAAQFRSPRRLLAMAAEQRANLVHFANINHLTFPWWKRLIPRTTRIVATAHDVRRAKSIVSRHWETRALQDFYRSCDALFVHSHSQRSDLQSFADVDSGRIHLVPHGPYPYQMPSDSRDKIRRRLGLPTDATVALCFGSVRDDKNIAHTIQALQQSDTPDILLVAGRGGGKGNRPVTWYQQLAAAAGLQDRCRFLNRHIDDAEVGELFTAADVACLTYRTGFTSQSGVLNVAMHFGTPVVATPAPTIAETVQNYSVGVVCEDDSADGIRRGFERWKSQRHHFPAERFERYRDEHSWRRNAELTADVYQSLCESDCPTVLHAQSGAMP